MCLNTQIVGGGGMGGENGFYPLLLLLGRRQYMYLVFKVCLKILQQISQCFPQFTVYLRQHLFLANQQI